jgi:orotidine-5'-phosphate decarboxylase
LWLTWSDTVPEVVLALDVPAAAEALSLVERLPALRWVKVGPILMTREGPGLIRTLLDRGIQVFLDLKWHDIPNTVAGAVTAAREVGVGMATVHALGGREMLEAAAAAADGRLDLVGVTVLTSYQATEYARATGREKVDLASEVQRLAGIALGAGLRGVVCSAREVSVLRERLGPDPYLVVPGIRRSTDAVGDQVRVATAREAAESGATHLVVGRPVLQAQDPAAALDELFKEAGCVKS